MLLLLARAAAAYDPSCQEPLDRDLNCNAIDAVDELPVDLSDPDCAANIDPETGQPFATADAYYDYAGYGCTIPVLSYDTDGDGFGDTTISLPEGAPYPDIVSDLDCDNCPELANPEQEDLDCDDVGDPCDNCVDLRNNDQSDQDADGRGDACDLCPLDYDPEPRDGDGDGVGDACDVCPFDADPSQGDQDEDGVGNRCDVCPEDADPAQPDFDLDGAGDACDACPAHYDPFPVDTDADGVPDPCDVCPEVADPAQADTDLDGVGDACDDCVGVFDPEQSDLDDDRVGDLCDVCPRTLDLQFDSDGDGFGDACDNCRYTWNGRQTDLDGDHIGDACDVCPGIADPTNADRDFDGDGDSCDVALRGGGRIDAGGCSTGPTGVSWAVALLVALAACGKSEPRPQVPPTGDTGTPACRLACPEVCRDGIDNDGDGLEDCADLDCAGACAEACADGIDNDGDRLVDAADPHCVDADGDDVPADVDCDDHDPEHGGPVVWREDTDGDGWGGGLSGGSEPSCVPPGPGLAPAYDCDESDAAVHPGATEACTDGVDQDCDGVDPVCLTGDLGTASAAGTLTGAGGVAGLGRSIARGAGRDLLVAAEDGVWRWPVPQVGAATTAALEEVRFEGEGLLALAAAGDRVAVGGAATVWLLDPAAPQTPLATLSGSIGFGRSIAAGDLDGDPYVDLLVGGMSGEPGALLLRGPLAGLVDATATATATFEAIPGTATASLPGDLDGDGEADVVLGSTNAVLAWRAPLGGVWTATQAERTWNETAGDVHVAAAGDTDGDGRAEVIATGTDAGAAWLLAWGPSGPAPDVALATFALPGVALAAGGSSVDGDGAPDLLLADPTERGRAWLFAAPLAGALAEEQATALVTGATTVDGLASSVLVTDTNGDDLADLVLGAPGADEVRLWLGTWPP